MVVVVSRGAPVTTIVPVAHASLVRIPVQMVYVKLSLP